MNKKIDELRQAIDIAKVKLEEDKKAIVSKTSNDFVNDILTKGALNKSSGNGDGSLTKHDTSDDLIEIPMNVLENNGGKEIDDGDDGGDGVALL
jgi:hypothetical protein